MAAHRFRQAVTHGLNQRAAFRIFQQIVLQIRIAPHRPDVASTSNSMRAERPVFAFIAQCFQLSPNGLEECGLRFHGRKTRKLYRDFAQSGVHVLAVFSQDVAAMQKSTQFYRIHPGYLKNFRKTT